MTTGMRLSADLAEALGRCTGLAAESHTLPAACYVDPEVAALEAETVFRQGWLESAEVIAGLPRATMRQWTSVVCQ